MYTYLRLLAVFICIDDRSISNVPWSLYLEAINVLNRDSDNTVTLSASLISLTGNSYYS